MGIIPNPQSRILITKAPSVIITEGEFPQSIIIKFDTETVLVNKSDTYELYIDCQDENINLDLFGSILPNVSDLVIFANRLSNVYLIENCLSLNRLMLSISDYNDTLEQLNFNSPVRSLQINDLKYISPKFNIQNFQSIEILDLRGIQGNDADHPVINISQIGIASSIKLFQALHIKLIDFHLITKYLPNLENIRVHDNIAPDFLDYFINLEKIICVNLIGSGTAIMSEKTVEQIISRIHLKEFTLFLEGENLVIPESVINAVEIRYPKLSVSISKDSLDNEMIEYIYKFKERYSDFFDEFDSFIPNIQKFLYGEKGDIEVLHLKSTDIVSLRFARHFNLQMDRDLIGIKNWPRKIEIFEWFREEFKNRFLVPSFFMSPITLF